MKKIFSVTALFIVIAHTLSAQCNCANVGPELVTNGDFSLGNTGFTTVYHPASFAWPENYGIVTDASLANPGSWDMCHDHTTGSGNFLWADASMASYNLPIWSKTITVLPNTNYVFSYW